MKGILILTLSISSVFLFGQGRSSADGAALRAVVKEFKEAINDGDAERFNALFFSESVPFVGIMSKKTEKSVKKDYPRFEGLAVSNSQEFINDIVDSKKKQVEKIYNIKKDSDGNIANVSFDYAFYSGNSMKQWGHEKWNLVNDDGDWLITDVVYSIHFPDVEPCPFDKDETASTTRPSKKPARTYSKPKFKKKENQDPFGDADDDDDDVDEEEDDDYSYDDDDDEEDDYADADMEEEEAPKVIKKKKKPFTVYVNKIKNRSLMAGIQNVVTIDYDGVAPSKINLFINTKDVEYFRQENGSYIVKPLRKVDDFPAYIRVGSKTINYTFKVKGIPLPVARLGRQQTSVVRQAAFRSEAGLLAVVPSPSKEVKQGKCRIQSFIITKNPDTKSVKSKLNKGGRFEQSTLKIVKSAKSGDVYTFEQIKCICAGESSSRKLKDLRYEIK